MEGRGERIDICINAAGVYEATPVFEDDLKNNFEALFQTNTFGTWLIIKAVAAQRVS
ncbi:MAG: hypothetical protein K2W99_04745 [Chthoniobacterales bacterium]|nr:hypothetical protein [Chthoniobacterales bacterium]